jgi:thiol-disulfide isomerase/thioredoxin
MSIVTTAGALSAATATGRAAVLFQSTACPFCRAFAPEFRRTVGHHPDIREVEVLLDDEYDPLWTQFDIEVLPSVVFFEDGMVVSRLDGRLGVGLSTSDLEESLNAFWRGAA